MPSRSALVSLLALFMCALVSACGTTGKTTQFVLPLDTAQFPPQIGFDIRIASSAMEKDSAYLNAVKVRPWGKYEPDDLRNLEESLRGTVSSHLPSTPSSAKPKLDIHVVIRRHVLSTSNTGAAILSCVAWAATNSQGSVIYREQFYASEAGRFVGTVGSIKDAVHKTIVRRIAAISYALAAGQAGNDLPTTFENTSTSFEEASAGLPRLMVSLSPAGLSGANHILWELARAPEVFDWQQYLEKQYPELKGAASH